MPTCDTSWLIALFDEQDPHHEQEVREAATAPRPATIPSVILGEFLGLVTYRLRQIRPNSRAPKIARTMLHEIERKAGVHIQDQYDVEAASELYRHNGHVSSPDAVAVVVARSRRDALFTFDDRQRRLVSRDL